MKKNTKIMLGILSILVVLGFSAVAFNSNSFAMARNWKGPVSTDNKDTIVHNNIDHKITNYSNGSMINYHSGMMGRYNNGIRYSNDDRYSNNNNNNYRHNMVGPINRGRGHNNTYGGYGGCGSTNRNFVYEDYDSDKVLSLDTLKANVKEYLSYYDAKLEIEDIFVYSNSEYYFSIVEEETGKGAMELLVDPITGYVFPEYGPNMMWNVKYGMHGNGYGMMGRYNFNSDIDYDKVIDKEEALEQANEYMTTYSDSNYEVEEGGHEFYGYYTFHVTEEDKTVGMLSYNYYTGEIWYHNWHGNLSEVISGHHE